MRQPPSWPDEQLEAGLAEAKRRFREERLKEPLGAYTEAFDQCRVSVERLLSTTDGLRNLDQSATEILASESLQEAFRYIAGPPISKDDLITLAEARLSPSGLRLDREMLVRVIDVVRTALDRRRFPWIVEERDATDSERHAAIVASSALLATSRVGASRRNVGKERQELAVCNALLDRGWAQVPPREVSTFSRGPAPGEFCRESLLGSSKADLLVGLRDRRLMAIECKVSNSSTNSVKRLNREAAGKAEKWIRDFGALNVVPVAVLSGVFKLHNLKNAQERGLTIFWAHSLSQLVDWVDTRA